jgi:hypothetical protein
MSKFEEILNRYTDIIEELAVPQPNIDLSMLDKASGEQIKAGLAEFLGNDQARMDEVLQGLVNSKSINPNPAVAAPTKTAAAATADLSANSPQQRNPAVNSERTAASAPAY